MRGESERHIWKRSQMCRSAFVHTAGMPVIKGVKRPEWFEGEPASYVVGLRRRKAVTGKSINDELIFNQSLLHQWLRCG